MSSNDTSSETPAHSEIAPFVYKKDKSGKNREEESKTEDPDEAQKLREKIASLEKTYSAIKAEGVICKKMEQALAKRIASFGELQKSIVAGDKASFAFTVALSHLTKGLEKLKADEEERA